MLALDPGEVIYELPAIDRFEPESDPLHADLGVRNVACERHVRRTGGLVEQSALVGTPQLVEPVHAGRDRRPSHEPPIPGYGRMVEQVVLDDVIELLIGVVRGDTLIKAVADVVGILLRREPWIVFEATALHLAAIADAAAVRPA